MVLTDGPLKRILEHPEASGRLFKWAILLGAYDVSYQPHSAIKGQALADFIAKSTIPTDVEPPSTPGPTWELFVDGSSNSAGSGVGILLRSPEGAELQYALKLNFPASNNVSEYEALISGARMARCLGAERAKIHTDSLLVASQINGNYEAREEPMVKYLQEFRVLMTHFESFEVVRIAGEENSRADALSRLASSLNPRSNRSVLLEELERPSYKSELVVIDFAPPSD